MVIATVGEVVAAYRSRAALDPARVAKRAGISTAQYLALEQGTAWPGTEVVEAVIKALRIPDSQRARLAAAGPLDPHLQSMLHRYDIPSLIVDSTWRTVEANSFARALLPDSSRVGWNLMRWTLFDTEARRRLANWDDVAQHFSGILHAAITAAPRDPELRSIRDEAAHLNLVSHSSPTNCPEGQVLIWRSDSGPYSISACLITVPGGRPDLRQVTFVPRSTRPTPVLMATGSAPVPWYGPLLIDLITCGRCGLFLTCDGQPGRRACYNCATGCLPELAADELEFRVAQQVLTRAFPAQACREFGVAQEVLTADGIELELNVPVSAKHALDQWRRSMTDTQRRGLLTATLRAATVHPLLGPGGHPELDKVDLAYSWLEQA